MRKRDVEYCECGWFIALSEDKRYKNRYMNCPDCGQPTKVKKATFRVGNHTVKMQTPEDFFD